MKTSTRKTRKKKHDQVKVQFYRDHDALFEKYWRYEHPKDVIEESTTEEDGSNLWYQMQKLSLENFYNI